MPPPPSGHPQRPASKPPPSSVIPADATGRPRVFVANLDAQNVQDTDAAAMTQAIATTLEGRGLFSVLTTKDVQQVMEQERSRQLTGACVTDPASCSSNLAALTGARYVLSGTLAKIGTIFEINVQMVDTVKGERLGRATRLASDLVTLRLLLPYVVAEATGTPLPPPQPRWLQYGLMAAGGAAVIGGGTLGMLALGRASTLNDELCPSTPFDVGDNDSNVPDSCAGVNLRPRAFYEEQNASIGTQKTWALAMMVAGVGLAAAGIYLMPPPEGGPRVAFIPGPGGLAIVGEWP